MSEIKIKVIPHGEQRLRNGDIADYYKDNNDYIIAVSDLGNPDYNFLVQLHEFIELHMILRNGIKIEDIDKWDCEHPETMGDDPFAPYKREHFFATMIERLVADRIGVSWSEYEKCIESLSEWKRYDSN